MTFPGSACRETTPELTVVIVARNALATIAECLTSLRRQNTDRRFELVLIDSSTDETPTLVEREPRAVKPLRFAGRVFSRDGRNIGARAPRSPVGAFLDADWVAGNRWVEAMCRAHEASVADDLARPSIRADHTRTGGPRRPLLRELVHGRASARVHVELGGFGRGRRPPASARLASKPPGRTTVRPGRRSGAGELW